MRGSGCSFQAEGPKWGGDGHAGGRRRNLERCCSGLFENWKVRTTTLSERVRVRVGEWSQSWSRCARVPPPQLFVKHALNSGHDRSTDGHHSAAPALRTPKKRASPHRCLGIRHAYHRCDEYGSSRSAMSLALADTYERSHRRLRALAARYVGGQDAEDVLHDACVRALEHRDSFRREAVPATWLHRIVVNACIDDFRKRSRRRLVDIESNVTDPRMATRPVQQTTVLVHAALQSLTLSAQRLCTLYYIMGYSHREISASLGIPIGTSKSQLHVARHRLRRFVTAPSPLLPSLRVVNANHHRSEARDQPA